MSSIIKGLPNSFQQFCEDGNDRFKYLDEYLYQIGCKTIIIESDYIDGNYLEDYSRYYSRCFEGYLKTCVRIHLFSNEFTGEIFKERLLATCTNTEDVFFAPNYLGFIVIRPLPNAPLGKVCLATYPSEDGKNRYFPALRSYEAQLCGHILRIDSLAFQEQDKAVSACATSALWSALHGTAGIDVTRVPAPTRITENARKIILQRSFNRPNRGLSLAQMANSVREEGLEPLALSFGNVSSLKAIIRAYVPVGVTPEMNMLLYYEDESGMHESGVPYSAPIGNHAVAIAGYNMLDKMPREFKIEDIDLNIPMVKKCPMYLLSSSINKLYVHDDEVGPFATMEFGGEYWDHLHTRWYMYRNNPRNVNATPTEILLPKPHKIRIRFQTIFTIIRELNSNYLGMLYSNGLNVVWDIYLTTVNKFKNEIVHRDKNIFKNPQSKLDILDKSFPRYMWRVDGYVVKNDAEKPESMNFTYLFDATGTENSELFLLGIHYDLISFSNMFISMMEEYECTADKQSSKFLQSRRIIDEYRDGSKMIY